MNIAVAIFVKTPGRSPVKTRLAARKGAPYAEAWYRRAAAATASVVPEGAYWAVAEPDADKDGPWQGLPCIAQGEGSLGARMAAVHAELVARHGAGILVGADSPQLSAALLDEARSWLASTEPRGVIGPSADGGFWLVGANRILPEEDWTAVAYSRPDTGLKFRERMERHGAWLTLATLADVDDADDLVELDRALGDLERPTPEQRALQDWMRTTEENQS